MYGIIFSMNLKNFVSMSIADDRLWVHSQWRTEGASRPEWHFQRGAALSKGAELPKGAAKRAIVQR